MKAYALTNDGQLIEEITTKTESESATPAQPSKPAESSQLEAELARLRAENAQLKKLKASQRTARPLSCKVSPKGAVSVYGLGRWPVTLYASQMERLLASRDQIIEFMSSNVDRLDFKKSE